MDCPELKNDIDYYNAFSPASNEAKSVFDFLKKALTLQQAANQTSSIRYSYLLHGLDYASARLRELEECAGHADVYYALATLGELVKYASVSPKSVLINVQ